MILKLLQIIMGHKYLCLKVVLCLLLGPNMLLEKNDHNQEIAAIKAMPSSDYHGSDSQKSAVAVPSIFNPMASNQSNGSGGAIVAESYSTPPAVLNTPDLSAPSMPYNSVSGSGAPAATNMTAAAPAGSNRSATAAQQPVEQLASVPSTGIIAIGGLGTVVPQIVGGQTTQPSSQPAPISSAIPPAIVITSSIPAYTYNPNLTVGYTVDSIEKTKSFLLTEGANSLIISETNAAGLSALKEIDIVLKVNKSPLFDPIGNKIITDNAKLEFAVNANDPDSGPDPLSYSVSGLPPNATFDPATRTFSWSTTYKQNGAYNVIFTAFDGMSTVSQSVAISVNNTNRPPVLTLIGDKSVNENSPLAFTVSATDPDSDPITYSASGLPSGASFDPGTHIFSWTPDYGKAGTYQVTFTATDGIQPVLQTINIIVNPTAPSITTQPSSLTLNPGSQASFSIIASGTAPLTYQWTKNSVPISGATGPTYTIDSVVYDDAGNYACSVTNTAGSVTSSSATLVVNGLKFDPLQGAYIPTWTPASTTGPVVIDASNNITITIPAGTYILFDQSATDAAGNPLTFSADIPENISCCGANFNPNGSHRFYWQIPLNIDGTYIITFAVSDGALTDTRTATIIVQPYVPTSSTTYYVALTGNDSNTGSEASPFQTLAKGVSVLKPGDTLLINPGTYNEHLGWCGVGSVPGGNSWDSPVTIAAITKGTVVLTGDNNELCVIDLSTPNQKYIIFDGLVVDAGHIRPYGIKLQTRLGPQDTGGDHIRITNCEIKNSAGQGVGLGVLYTELINDSIHDNGTSTQFDHGIYCGTSNFIIDNCDIYNNKSHGIHMWTGDTDKRASNNIIRNSRIHENNVGIGFYMGDNNAVYNNVIYNCPSVGIVMEYGNTTSNIFNNTLYNASLAMYGSAGDPTFGATGEVIENNIVVGAGCYNSDAYNTFVNNIIDRPFQDSGTSTTVSNNNIVSVTDVKFANFAGYDFHLTTGSPAIDAGLMLSDVTTDADDVIRPQGSGYDIGAYEYVPSNRPPVIATIGDKTVSEAGSLAFTVSATDPDNDPIAYSASGLPSGASFDAVTHTFSWTPTYDQAGNYSVTFYASDGTLSASQVVNITVANVNRPPVINPIGNQTVNEGEALEFTLLAVDPDGDPLIYSVGSLPQGAVFDVNTHVFTWTPDYGKAGTYPVTFTVTDGIQPVSKTVTITVNYVNSPPVITPIPDQSVNEGETLYFTVSAVDPHGLGLTYSASGLPECASFNALTRTFGWSTVYNDAGTYTVTFTVSNGLLSSSQDVVITVIDVPSDPVIYYAALVGDDSSPGTEEQPFRTIAKGISVLKPGDTLLIGSGEYDEAITYSGPGAIPGGESWDKPVTIAAQNPGTVTMKATSAYQVAVNLSNARQKYIIMDGIIFDAQNVTNHAMKFESHGMDPVTYKAIGAAHHIRIKNCEIKNAPATGIHVTAGSDNCEFINLKIHHNGTTGYDHGLYLCSHNNTVDGCEIYDNAGFGVHVYNSRYDGIHPIYEADNNIVRNCRIHNNSVSGGGAGIAFYTGNNNIAYNNIVWDNCDNIIVGWDAINTKIMNNTCVTINPPCLAGIYIYDTAESAVIENNISWGGPSPIDNWSSSSTIDHNLTGQDPKFVDESNYDFHIVSDSPAVDAGTTLADVTTDSDGVTRPQGCGYDIGAYEYIGDFPIMVAIGDKAVNEGDTLMFTVSANDPIGRALSYSAAGLPEGATFDPATHVFTWTPAYRDAGTHNVLFTVSNGALSASETVTITANFIDVDNNSLPDTWEIANFGSIGQDPNAPDPHHNGNTILQDYLLYQTFNNYLVANRNEIQAEVLTGDAGIYYTTSYYINGLLSAVEATKDEALLQETMGYIDTMIDRATTTVYSAIGGGAHLEWLPVENSHGYLRPEQMNHYQGSVPIARAAAIIMNIPEFKTKYQANAQRYIDFVDDSVIKYWFDKDTGEYNALGQSNWPWLAGQIPWLTLELGGWGSYDDAFWADRCSLLGSIVTCLYKATGDPLYKEMATRIGTGFKSRLKPNGDGWIYSDSYSLDYWQRYFSWYLAPAYDTSHANREPMMMVLMYEAGIVFTLDDIQRMGNTLTDIIWNNSIDNPRFADYIDGELVGIDGNPDPYSIGNIYAGWALLGKYSTKAQTALKATLDAIQNGQNPGQNSTGCGEVALAGHLLRNLKGSQ